MSVTKLQNTGSALEWRLTFQNSLGGSNVSQGATADEVQTVTLSNASGGTFRLAFLGEITPPLDFDTDAGDVESSLEDLNSVDEENTKGDRSILLARMRNLGRFPRCREHDEHCRAAMNHDPFDRRLP